MSSVAYLNGQYLPLKEAKVSVLDRGFIFADGVYEVILINNRHPFRLKEHIARLNNNLEQIYLDKPYTLVQWEEMIYTLIDSNADRDCSLYMQVTRGVSDRRHAIEAASTPTIFAMLNPLLMRDRDHSIGISAIIAEDIRWRYCHIKALTLLPSILLRHTAKQAGATEAILVRDGYVTEGAASNVFVFQDNIVKTPPNSHNLLSGITRELLVELLEQSSIHFTEIPITETELRHADEIWLTSSTWEMTPVITLDSKPVGTGKPGNIFRQVAALYQAFKRQKCI